MQKWHVHAALGRGRPRALRSLATIIRQFNVSQKQAQKDDLSPTQEIQLNRFRRHLQNTEHYKDPKPRSTDARILAAIPPRAPKPPGKSTSERLPARRDPLDARNLGAQPSSNGPRIIRTSAGFPDEDRGPRMRPRRDPSDRYFEGGVSSAQHNRDRSTPNRPQSQRIREAGANRGAKEGKERRGPPRSGTGNFQMSLEANNELTEEEIEYLRTRDHVSFYNDTDFGGQAAQYTRSRQYQTYTPAALSLDSLQGHGPPLACGEWGMSETVGEKILQVNQEHDRYDNRISELAHKWGEGESCHFRSKQERADTLRTVERNLAGTGDNAKIDEEKEKEKMALVDTRMREETGKLATRLLKGEYYIGPLGKGATAELLGNYTKKNESYLPKDREALVGKIGTLLPLGAVTSSVDSAKM
ncbi:MAG: hypothetical protein Q9170_007081 [Blastenia crenularia]